MQDAVTHTNPQNAHLAADDEIDLFELWQGLVQEKWTIVASIIIVMVLAAGYAFSVKPAFKSTAYLLPPELELVQELNRLDVQLGRAASYSPQRVFDIFTQNLNSRSAMLSFFKANNLVEVYAPTINTLQAAQYQEAFNKAFEQFLKDFTVSLPKKDTASGQVSVALSLTVNEALLAQLLNKNIAEVVAISKTQIVNEINNDKKVRLEQLQQEITSARKIALDQRMDKVASLEEAIAIARALNIEEPTTMGPTVEIQSVQNQGMPLYYLGFKLLEAEKSALLKRTSDDPYIAKLRGLQESYDSLNAVNINPDRLSVARIDQAAEIGEKVKPKNRLF
ncbi:LPS O-antigen chain length determinant protein WzzB [Thiomicrorhabdus aquaedulcis]|uniref:LPS O-antigen chain length determinant protein WzzB n=1 Tax=Thiomicrorhabdus aquaedulcis TaxID=2211106 RepID=UPI000FD6F323|nr:Wzz/FepE/Etk N-terminal domain-containing protein [Thiomicrorhabdus aquaedulcis]